MGKYVFLFDPCMWVRAYSARFFLTSESNKVLATFLNAMIIRKIFALFDRTYLGINSMGMRVIVKRNKNNAAIKLFFTIRTALDTNPARQTNEKKINKMKENLAAG